MSFLSGIKSAAAVAKAAASTKMAEARATASATVGALREEWSSTLLLQPQDLEFSNSIDDDIENASETLSVGDGDLSADDSVSSSGASSSDESSSTKDSGDLINDIYKSIHETGDVNAAGNFLSSAVTTTKKSKNEMSRHSQDSAEVPKNGPDLGPSRPKIMLDAEVHDIELVDTTPDSPSDVPTDTAPTMSSNIEDSMESTAESDETDQGLSQLLNTIQDRTTRIDTVDGREPLDESDLVISEGEDETPPVSKAYEQQLKVKDDILKRREELMDQMEALAEEYEASEAVILKEESVMIRGLVKGAVEKITGGKTAASKTAESTTAKQKKITGNKTAVSKTAESTASKQKKTTGSKTAESTAPEPEKIIGSNTAAPKPVVHSKSVKKNQQIQETPVAAGWFSTMKQTLFPNGAAPEVEKEVPELVDLDKEAEEPEKRKSSRKKGDIERGNQIQRDEDVARKLEGEGIGGNREKQIKEDEALAKRVEKEDEIARRLQLEFDARLAESKAAADRRIADLSSVYKRRFEKYEKKDKERELLDKEKKSRKKKQREEIIQRVEEESRGSKDEDEKLNSSFDSEAMDSELSMDEDDQAVSKEIEMLTRKNEELKQKEADMYKKARRTKKKESRRVSANMTVEKLQEETEARQIRVQKALDIHLDSSEGAGYTFNINNLESDYQFRPGDNRNSTPYPKKSKTDSRDSLQSDSRSGDHTSKVNGVRSIITVPPKTARAAFTELEKTMLLDGGVPEDELDLLGEERMEEQHVPVDTSTVQYHLSITKDDAPEFSGSIVDYMDWRRSFQSVIQKFPVQDQLDSLRKKLGPSRSLIRACTGRPETALVKAWGLLEDEFGDKELLAHELTAQLRGELVPYTTTVKFIDSLRGIREKFDKLVRIDPASINSCNKHYLDELLKAMPKYLGTRIVRENRKKGKKMTFSYVLKEAEDEVGCMRETDRRLGPANNWGKSKGRVTVPLGRGANVNSAATDGQDEESREVGDDEGEEEDNVPSASVNSMQGGGRGRGAGSGVVGRGRGLSSRGGTAGASNRHESGGSHIQIPPLKNSYPECRFCDANGHKTLDCPVIPTMEPQYLREMIRVRRICALCGGRNHVSTFCSLIMLLEKVPWHCKKPECLPTPHAVALCCVYKKV